MACIQSRYPSDVGVYICSFFICYHIFYSIYILYSFITDVCVCLCNSARRYSLNNVFKACAWPEFKSIFSINKWQYANRNIRLKTSLFHHTPLSLSLFKRDTPWSNKIRRSELTICCTKTLICKYFEDFENRLWKFGKRYRISKIIFHSWERY